MAAGHIETEKEQGKQDGKRKLDFSFYQETIPTISILLSQ
jgi:hypothetical protein